MASAVASGETIDDQPPRHRDDTMSRRHFVVINKPEHPPPGRGATMAGMTTTRSIESDLAARALEWYGLCARDLPWRRPDVGPWAVLVSEVMLQQTPVNRVLPA